MKWKDVPLGSVVILKGQRWTVGAADRNGKTVTVTVTGPGGSFTREMRAKDEVEVVPTLAGSTPGPTPGPIDEAERAKQYDALLGPEDKTEKRIRKELGGTLLAVLVDGVYVMPWVGPDTILAHLHTFHNCNAEGVSLADVRPLESSHRAEDALATGSWDHWKKLHDDDHLAAEAGTKRLHIPHQHTSGRPTSA